MSFQNLLDAPAPILGTWSQIASAEVVDIIAASGFAFTIIDTEHGVFGLETAADLIRACNANRLEPIVRVPTNESWMIMKALDAGAGTVLVPKIESPEAAQAAVAAARYEPHGRRGACPCVRSGDQFVRDWPNYAAKANSSSGVMALVESPVGVEAFSDIAATQGLKAVLFGPFDLSVAMGKEGNFRHPDVVSALETMTAQARKADLPVIMPVFSPDMDQARREMQEWRAQGVSAFTIGTDKLLMADYCSRYTAHLKN
ncbi:HpcH/HpaI aldolase family protein [Fodinicurvata sediminis]|uniref:HpcH/HpaI aldolase family protein n=1 Tax=Fodinicurvata sediminis TaxID=1121832 RepID=UPI0003B31378|nr:aldolase/citrate lyase family protein [Fodinicurvata sediminis]